LEGRNLVAPVDGTEICGVAIDSHTLTAVVGIAIHLDAGPAVDTNRSDAIVPASAV
jgi:hypothetical protein